MANQWYCYLTEDLSERPTADDIRADGQPAGAYAPDESDAEEAALEDSPYGAGPFHVWYAGPAGQILCFRVAEVVAYEAVLVTP